MKSVDQLKGPSKKHRKHPRKGKPTRKWVYIDTPLLPRRGSEDAYELQYLLGTLTQ